MAERKRSKDGTRDTESVLGAAGTISQQGRADGDIARDVATRDEGKRAFERPSSPTRPENDGEKDQ